MSTVSPPLTYEDLGDSVRRIVLTGRLDNPGTEAMAEELRELAAAPKKGVIVDLTGVPFLASVGIGQLILNARAVKARGGILVLLAVGGSGVMTSLKMAGIDQLIPVYDSPPDAYAAAMRGF
jgi:anti-anti-sigma factor